MMEESLRSGDQDLDIQLPDWMDDPNPGDPGTMVFGDHPAPALDHPAAGNGQMSEAPSRRRNIYKSSEWIRVSPLIFRCRVTVAADKGEFTGEADGPEVPGVRAEISARATIDALNQAEGGDLVLALKGARVLRVFETPMVVVAMYALNSGETASLVGSCMVHNSVEQATIQATLQAADRWLSWQATRRH